MEKYVLGVDIGSGSVKLTLLSQKGKIAATAGCEYETIYPQVGWSEQNPDDWCKAFGSAFAEIKKIAGVQADQIEALSVDAATHTAVLLDNNKKVLRRAILWTDQRSVEEVNELKEKYRELITQQCKNEPTTVWTLPQMMWLRKHEPQVWEKIRYILFAKDYLRYCLTGSMETDHIDAAGSMFYDAGKEQWSKELCEIGHIREEWLPRVCNPTDVAGEVSKEAAENYGLKAGTKVLVGTTDTVMEVFASGNVKKGHATVKLATAGRICVVTDKEVDSPFVFNYRHVVPGLWYPGTATSSCAASYRWYRDSLGKQPFEELNVGAEKIPAGSDGLMFHPYLQGELTPYNDPLLKASYSGISSRHTKAHFTRATLEGVAFSLKDCMNTVQELGMEMSRLRIIGGGAKGMLWRQIVADVLGMRLEKIKVDDSSFGTAMLTAVGIGWFRNYEEAVDCCVEIDSVSEPHPEQRKIYEGLFRKYKDIHDALEGIYKKDYSI